jgi:GNAT superfamily N-acetyltransferase
MSPAIYRVRRAYLENPQDARTLSALDDALLPGCPETPENADACAWWLCEAVDVEEGDAEAVGYCGARRLRPDEPGAGAVYLARYGVVGGHGGRKLGRRLLRAASRWARWIGATEIQTYTIDNPPSANALIAVGYRQFASPWAIPGEGVSYWRLRL